MGRSSMRNSLFQITVHNGFILSYPEEQKNEYDEIVGNIERSFRPGWTTGYKIWG